MVMFGSANFSVAYPVVASVRYLLAGKPTSRDGHPPVPSLLPEDVGILWYKSNVDWCTNT